MFMIPTMDDYWQLALRYDRRDDVNAAVLKLYGVMACQAFVEEHFGHRGKDVRLMDVGHGLSPIPMSLLQHKHDVWGLDDNQSLGYFDGDWEAEYRQRILKNCPMVTLKHGLLGTPSQPAELEPESFDAIWTISILEEVSEEIVDTIVGAAARLLKPGGWLIGTHDLNSIFFRTRVRIHLDAHRKAGLAIDGAPDPDTLELDWRRVLLEHPLSVMISYQGAELAEQRKFWGHYATMFTAAQRR